MLRGGVLPNITAMMGDIPTLRQVRVVTTFGLPESTLAERIRDFSASFPMVKLGLRARFPEIHIRLYLTGTTTQGMDRAGDAATGWLGERLGDYVLSRAGEDLPAVVGRLLRSANRTVALAESCTGGLVASRLTDIAGSSDYFLYAAVTYANQAKIVHLGVDPKALNRYGAVHPDIARQMADGVRRGAGADYGLATSGIAGPGGGSPEKPVGTVCIGIASAAGSLGLAYRFPYQDRAMNKIAFGATALNVLRLALDHGLASDLPRRCRPLYADDHPFPTGAPDTPGRAP